MLLGQCVGWSLCCWVVTWRYIDQSVVCCLDLRVTGLVGTLMKMRHSFCLNCYSSSDGGIGGDVADKNNNNNNTNNYPPFLSFEARSPSQTTIVYVWDGLPWNTNL